MAEIEHGSNHANVDGERGRPLGSQEVMDQVFISQSSTGIYWHIGVINSTQSLEASIVLKALKILQRKQEALQMRIVPQHESQAQTTEFLFKPMEDSGKIDFESVQFKSKHDWPMFISQDHDSNKLDCRNGPLWRAVFASVENPTGPETDGLQNEYLILFKLHHAIADGISAFDMLYRQFLPILAALVNDSDAENVIDFVPLTKSVEELFLTADKLKNPVPWYVKLIIDVLRWKNRKFYQLEKPRLMFPDDPIPSAPAKDSSCVPAMFDKDVTGNVITAAKAHGVSVHCLLLSAGSLALSRTAKAARVQLPSTISIAWPIDLRKFTDYTTPQPLGDLHSAAVSNHKTVTELTKDQFWKSCKELYSTSVERESRKENCTKSVGIARYFVDSSRSTDIFTVFSEMSTNMYISLSNLGNTSAGKQPKMADDPVKIRLVEHWFSLSGIAGLEFVPMVQAVVTFEGRLMINMIHDPRKTSRMFVQIYLQNLEDILKTYCASE